MSGSRTKLAILAVVALTAVGGAMAVSGAQAEEEATYVGVSKCRLCHMEQYKSWKEKGAHATAFGDLLPEEQKDPECFKCHVTGYGEETGFKNAEDTPELKNVGCEACHGPGSAHVKIAGRHMGQSGDWPKKIDKVRAGMCVQCHNQHKNFKKRAEKLREQK